MAITVDFDRDDREWTPAPQGLQDAVCVDVVDMGMQQTQWGEKPKVQVRWELPNKPNPDFEDGRPHLVVKTYTLSMHKKSNLYADLEGWRGAAFTDDDRDGGPLDLEALIGKPCTLQIMHSARKEGKGVWASVKNVMPPRDGADDLQPSEFYVRMCDREPEPDADGARGVPF